MTDDDDYGGGYDPTGEDAEVRELRERVRELEAAIFRQSAETDQLAALVAEMRAETAAVELRMNELEAAMGELREQQDAIDRRIARMRRVYGWLLPLTWAVCAAAIALNVWGQP